MNILIQQLCSELVLCGFQSEPTYLRTHTHRSGTVSDKVANSLLSGGSGLYSRAWYTTLDLATLHTSDTTRAPTLISTRHFTALLSLSKLSCCSSRGVTIAALMSFSKLCRGLSKSRIKLRILVGFLPKKGELNQYLSFHLREKRFSSGKLIVETFNGWSSSPDNYFWQLGFLSR